MSRAMVVLSGGQDSTTCLAWAKQTFRDVYAVTFNYGQRHWREIMAAEKVANMLDVASHEVVVVPDVLRSRSPLTDHNTELETYDNFASMDAIIGNRVELTFVPMRNAFFLTIAANIALSKDCRTLVTGVCQQDNANYPDCRKAFIDAQEQTINEALGIDDFRIVTPLMQLTKSESVHLAVRTPGAIEALAWSHTCYAGDYPPCGKCHACVLRAHGFEQAGIADPLLVRALTERASHD
jgi:7-cyano-7-deazaguanine synthase